MTILPHTVDIVVADMPKALAFYRLLGLDIPAEEDHSPQVQVTAPNGFTLGFVTEAMVLQNNPHWITPVGQRVTLAFSCDSPATVDHTYAAVEAAGHPGRLAPWDAVWGQRYAFLQDPDGNRVDLFAPLAGESA